MALKNYAVTQEECFVVNDTRSSKWFIGIDLAKDHRDVTCYNACDKCADE